MSKIITTEAEIRQIVREEMLSEQSIGVQGSDEANVAFDAMSADYFDTADVAVAEDIVAEDEPMRWEQAADVARGICSSD